jgi:hypothetical protein
LISQSYQDVVLKREAIIISLVGKLQCRMDDVIGMVGQC